jgi:electron transfer flavoprotein alpha subunit
VIAVVVEHDRGELAPATGEALTAARSLDDDLTALVCGADQADALVTELAAFGVGTVVGLDHGLLDDYGPEAWGQAVADWADDESPDALLACGTDRGNEVLAQVAARLDAPFIANCIEISTLTDGELVRVQWGGSLLERVTLDTDLPIVSVAPHAVEATPSEIASDPSVEHVAVDLDASLARTVVRERSTQAEGVTLSTAPVVVGGGRGVGSPEGFESLEELAELLGGRVGCSRAVTNNGWRNHKDQVGQTGTRIAPTIYIASGISGAVQHWVGAMASKHILAINTDAEANMVSKADWAVIADLHEVIPAISAEIRRRRPG